MRLPVIRNARLDDRPAIGVLIAESARGLSRDDYTDRQIESALETGVFGVDTALIEDGTYFVAETNGRLIGCGGWSRRRTLFGGDRFVERHSEELDPPVGGRPGSAPSSCARNGPAEESARRSSNAANPMPRAPGSLLEMMSTLPGRKLYGALGYVVGERLTFEMDDGVPIELVRMRKTFRMPRPGLSRGTARRTRRTGPPAPTSRPAPPAPARARS